MSFTSQYNGTLQYIRARWPGYVFGYGGGITFALLVIAVSLVRGWYSFVVISLASLLILGYFLFFSIWAAHHLYDGDAFVQILFELGTLKSEDSVVCIDLGRRLLATKLSKHLITGKIIDIDIYNPQLMPDRTLSRIRQQTGHPKPDPRLSWRDGRIDLLPLPDNSVPIVVMVQIASAFWESGDLVCLLTEVNRILTPGGRLLLAERLPTSTNIAIMGPKALRLKRSVFWQELITGNNFQITKEESLRDLMGCLRAEKLSATEAKQLALNL